MDDEISDDERVILDPHTVEIEEPPSILPPDDLCGIEGCVYTPHGVETKHSWETGSVGVI